MTQSQLNELYVHITCAEQTAQDAATRYRLGEAKRIVNEALQPVIKAKTPDESRGLPTNN